MRNSDRQLYSSTKSCPDRKQYMGFTPRGSVHFHRPQGGNPCCCGDKSRFLCLPRYSSSGGAQIAKSLQPLWCLQLKVSHLFENRYIGKVISSGSGNVTPTDVRVALGVCLAAVPGGLDPCREFPENRVTSLILERSQVSFR